MDHSELLGLVEFKLNAVRIFSSCSDSGHILCAMSCTETGFSVVPDSGDSRGLVYESCAVVPLCC